eukprot:CAMPEP_0194398642 /NCGR_PEP_ID=MMETSP0174-20130528/126220_1 /TAXON_ID=216777 /ORGANISM="Proboscia alata, Strain PI-D3" /LENGTH=449 /DNA_ID=CAMNT_0039194967 /DNA_START=43 /DNA_END=1389 /DNA_ORIENTATION=-
MTSSISNEPQQATVLVSQQHSNDDTLDGCSIKILPEKEACNDKIHTIPTNTNAISIETLKEGIGHPTLNEEGIESHHRIKNNDYDKHISQKEEASPDNGSCVQHVPSQSISSSPPSAMTDDDTVSSMVICSNLKMVPRRSSTTRPKQQIRSSLRSSESPDIRGVGRQRNSRSLTAEKVTATFDKATAATTMAWARKKIVTLDADKGTACGNNQSREVKELLLSDPHCDIVQIQPSNHRRFLPRLANKNSLESTLERRHSIINRTQRNTRPSQSLSPAKRPLSVLAAAARYVGHRNLRSRSLSPCSNMFTTSRTAANKKVSISTTVAASTKAPFVEASASPQSRKTRSKVTAIPPFQKKIPITPTLNRHNSTKKILHSKKPSGTSASLVVSNSEAMFPCTCLDRRHSQPQQITDKRANIELTVGMKLLKSFGNMGDYVGVISSSPAMSTP